MKKLINVLLVMLAVWGCSDDDDKRIENLGLPSDFFYQTVWEGQISPYHIYVGIEFISATEGIGKSNEEVLWGGGSNYAKFEYSLEDKVLSISRKNNNHTSRFDGNWFLTYVNRESDSLVFKQKAYADEPVVMTLKKVLYDSDGQK